MYLYFLKLKQEWYIKYLFKKMRKMHVLIEKYMISIYFNKTINVFK